MRRALTAVAVVAVTVGLIVGGGRSAHAHAVLEASNPAPGGQVDASPGAVVLDFTERPDPALISVRVLDGAGADVGAGDPMIDQTDATLVRVGLPGLDDGSYTVTWRVTSVDDGHTTAGSFAFGVGQPPSDDALAAAASAPRTPRPHVLAVVGRMALYAGSLALVGAAAMGLLVSRHEVGRGRSRLVVAWLGAAVGTALIVADEARRSGASIGRLLDSDTGGRLVVLVLALVVAGAVVVAHSLRPRRLTLAAVGVASGAVLLARAAGGHAGASSNAAVAIQWVHVLAIGVWVGGLAWLLPVLRRVAPDDRVATARRFSTVAAITLGLVVVTGTLRAVDEVGSWRLLTESAFGQTLLVKLGIVAVVVCLAAINRRRLARAGTSGWMSLGGAELGAGMAVLAVTAVLAGLAPATGAGSSQPPPPPQQVVVEGSDFATSVRVTLVAAPGTIGPNTFRLDVRDYDSDERFDADRVSLRFRLPAQPGVPAATVPLERAADGRWRADSGVLSVVGTWDVTAVVTTSDRGVEVPLRVRPRLPGQRVEAIETPGEPTIYTVVLDSGERVQGYADPAEAGFNEVHVTAFTPSGEELPLAAATITATGPDGGDRTLEVRRFGPGHFVADADLDDGRWDFLAVVQVEGGGELTIDFPTEIG